MKTLQEIYDHLYDPNMERADLYTRKSLCIWIRATLRAAINQGYLLGQKNMRKEIMEKINENDPKTIQPL